MTKNLKEKILKNLGEHSLFFSQDQSGLSAEDHQELLRQSRVDFAAAAERAGDGAVPGRGEGTGEAVEIYRRRSEEAGPSGGSH